MEVAQYSEGIASVLRRLFIAVGDNISTEGDNISTVRVFSTVEGYLQYCGGDKAVHVGGYLQYCGDTFSTAGDTFSTVEVVQYSGG